MTHTPATADNATRFTLHTEQRTHGTVTATHWWLLDESNPVGFLSTLTHHNRDEYTFVLCDIEIHPDHRRRRLTRTLVALAEAETGQRLWTSGSFTPLGAPALDWLPVLPGENPGVKFDDMTFVADWDTCRSAFPL